ncbi:hypothetical protein CPB86DRAFT_186914 [Serendipita vermifera]|nr:hypothetical protein CPB86DRAFT_186914 [Serendipita vermifera]
MRVTCFRVASGAATSPYWLHKRLNSWLRSSSSSPSPLASTDECLPAALERGSGLYCPTAATRPPPTVQTTCPPGYSDWPCLMSTCLFYLLLLHPAPMRWVGRVPAHRRSSISEEITQDYRNPDLERTVESGRRCIEASPSRHRYASKYQTERATKLVERYKQRSNLKDINKAIELSSSSMRLIIPRGQLIIPL